MQRVLLNRRINHKNFTYLASTALWLFAAGSFAGPVLAQGIRDAREITAPTNKTAVQAPRSLERAFDYTDSDTSDAVQTIEPSGSIKEAQISSFSLDSLGIYSEENGGFSASIWQGSHYTRLISLLRQLEAQPPASPSLRLMLATLLLSSTTPPDTETNNNAFFTARMNALFALGEMNGTAQLLARVPKGAKSEATDRLDFTAHLLKGDSAYVCGHINEALASYNSKTLFWQKISLFCLAQEKNAAKLQLAFDALNEQSIALDPAYMEMLETIAGVREKTALRLKEPVAVEDAAIAAISKQDVLPKNYSTVNSLGAYKPSPLQSWLTKQLSEETAQSFDFDDFIKELYKKSDKPLPAAQANRIAYRAYIILKALGYENIQASGNTYPNSVFVAGGQWLGSPLKQAELQQALSAQKSGESLLLTAILAGQIKDIATTDDTTIALIIHSLAANNRNTTARSVAAEALSALIP